MWLVFTLRFEK